MASTPALKKVLPSESQNDAKSHKRFPLSPESNTRHAVLRRLQHSSAIVLREDDELRGEVQTLIADLADNDKSIFILSTMPLAALPLSITAQTHPDAHVKARAARCLELLVDREFEQR